MPVQGAKGLHLGTASHAASPASEYLVKSDYLLDTGVQTALQKICLNNCCLILTSVFLSAKLLLGGRS